MPVECGSSANCSDTPVPLMAPALLGVSRSLVLLFAWSYFTIPREIYDLAREAGLGPFRTWWRVAVPMRIDVAGVAAAVAFMISWGNLVDPSSMSTTSGGSRFPSGSPPSRSFPRPTRG